MKEAVDAGDMTNKDGSKYTGETAGSILEMVARWRCFTIASVLVVLVTRRFTIY